MPKLRQTVSRDHSSFKSSVHDKSWPISAGDTSPATEGFFC